MKRDDVPSGCRSSHLRATSVHVQADKGWAADMIV